MLKYVLYILPVVFGFELIDRYIPTIRKELTFCENAEPILRETVDTVVNEINEYDIMYLSLHDNKSIKTNEEDTINSICSYQGYNGYFGYTSFYTDNLETDISISRLLYNTPITLQNVVKHEILHALGLNHTTEEGLMNYTLRVDNRGLVINDDKVLWLSLDDIKGLRFLRKSTCPTVN